MVIKELAERLGNLEAKIQSVALRSDGAEARSWERKPRDAGQKQQYRSTSDRLSPQHVIFVERRDTLKDTVV